MSMDVSAVAGAGTVQAMSGASAGTPPRQKMSNLFNQIDSSGSGSITQAQFSQAFQTQNPPAVFQQQGAAAIFSALDPAGTGSVSKSDFVAGMSKLMASLRADGGTSTAPGRSPAASLAASLQSLNSFAPGVISPNLPPGSLFNTTA